MTSVRNFTPTQHAVLLASTAITLLSFTTAEEVEYTCDWGYSSKSECEKDFWFIPDLRTSTLTFPATSRASQECRNTVADSYDTKTNTDSMLNTVTITHEYECGCLLAQDDATYGENNDMTLQEYFDEYSNDKIDEVTCTTPTHSGGIPLFDALAEQHAGLESMYEDGCVFDSEFKPQSSSHWSNDYVTQRHDLKCVNNKAICSFSHTFKQGKVDPWTIKWECLDSGKERLSYLRSTASSPPTPPPPTPSSSFPASWISETPSSSDDQIRWGQDPHASSQPSPNEDFDSEEFLKQQQSIADSYTEDSGNHSNLAAISVLLLGLPGILYKYYRYRKRMSQENNVSLSMVSEGSAPTIVTHPANSVPTAAVQMTTETPMHDPASCVSDMQITEVPNPCSETSATMHTTAGDTDAESAPTILVHQAKAVPTLSVN